MALSERDERMLREMERQFSAEDPELVQTMTSSHPSRSRLSPRRVGLGVALVLLGLVSLVAGVTVRHAVLGVLLGLTGFALAVLGIQRALSHEPDPRAQHRPVGPGAGKGSFMSRQEERWERRRQTER